MVVVGLFENRQQLPDFPRLGASQPAHAASSHNTVRISPMLPRTRSAPAKSLHLVSSVGTTMQLMPAALADSRPRAESSMATHASAGTPLLATARTYGSGSGLTRVKSPAVSTKSKYFRSPVFRWMTSKWSFRELVTTPIT